MDSTNNKIEGQFTNSVLLKYIDNVIEHKPLSKLITRSKYRIELFDNLGESSTIEVIDTSKLDYIILVTKLSTMIEMFKTMKSDENLVMADLLEKELQRFQDVVSESIIKTNNELINKEHGNR